MLFFIIIFTTTYFPKNYQLSLVILYRGLTPRLGAKAKAYSTTTAHRNHGEEVLLLVQKNVAHDLNLHPRVVVVAGDRLQQRRLPSQAAEAVVVGVWPSKPLHPQYSIRVQDHPVQGEQFLLYVPSLLDNAHHPNQVPTWLGYPKENNKYILFRWTCTV